MGLNNKEGPSLVNSVGDFAQLSYRAYDSVTDVTRHIIRHFQGMVPNIFIRMPTIARR